MLARELLVDPSELERLRMGARSALGEHPALQAYLTARFTAMAVDAGASGDPRLLARSYEIQQILEDLFLRPATSATKEQRL